MIENIDTQLGFSDLHASCLCWKVFSDINVLLVSAISKNFEFVNDLYFFDIYQHYESLVQMTMYHVLSVSGLLRHLVGR